MEELVELLEQQGVVVEEARSGQLEEGAGVQRWGQLEEAEAAGWGHRAWKPSGLRVSHLKSIRSTTPPSSQFRRRR